MSGASAWVLRAKRRNIRSGNDGNRADIRFNRIGDLKGSRCSPLPADNVIFIRPVCFGLRSHEAVAKAAGGFGFPEIGKHREERGRCLTTPRPRTAPGAGTSRLPSSDPTWGKARLAGSRVPPRPIHLRGQRRPSSGYLTRLWSPQTGSTPSSVTLENRPSSDRRRHG